MKRVNGAIIRECNKRTMKCFLLFRQHTILGVTLYLSIIYAFFWFRWLLVQMVSLVVNFKRFASCDV